MDTAGLSYGIDAVGMWATVECASVGCTQHLAGRPAEPGTSMLQMVVACLGWAMDEGWLLTEAGIVCAAHAAGQGRAEREAAGLHP